ncbi:hypothetical protein ANN_08377 [Periplaneta americana]|uniref:Uncharacterized protein n=1 Tax=Periplaneta americana TaxID=6978 RepID=A0ABQ8T2M9_PERAM|nr:hypothetical protein ANN_08377 [Periplaneta americana]
MAGLCEGGNERPGSSKPFFLEATVQSPIEYSGVHVYSNFLPIPDNNDLAAAMRTICKEEEEENYDDNDDEDVEDELCRLFVMSNFGMMLKMMKINKNDYKYKEICKEEKYYNDDGENNDVVYKENKI